MGLAATLPPAWVVVVFGDFDEAELLVIIRTDPFRGIERALLKRRIDIAGCELLRHGAQLAQDCAGKSSDAELEPFEVVDCIDLFTEPPTHLCPGVCRGKTNAVEVFQKSIEK